MRISKKMILFFITEAILAGLALVWAYRGIHSLKGIDLSIRDWTCPYTEYHDGAFSAEGDILDSGQEITFLYGPGTPLKKGTYAAEIQYEAEQDQYCMASGSNVDVHIESHADFITASKGILSHSKNAIVYRFELSEDTRNFQLTFIYNGYGQFQIKNIRLQQTAVYYKRTITTLLSVLLGLSLVYCYFKTKKVNHGKTIIRSYIIPVLSLTAISSLPLFFNNIGFSGIDIDFHLLRIEAVAGAIRDHQLPLRISSLWMDGYGFPASIYYNDILLAFPAVLRILGYNILDSIKAYIIFINFIASIIALVSFRKIFSDERTGDLIAISYILSPYRFSNAYVRNAIGEFTALTFLPLIAYGIVKMYTEDPEDWKQYHRYGLAAALGISGLIASHVLTLLMTMLILFITVLILFKKTFRRNTLRLWLDTGLLSIALNAYFLIPFIDYYFSADTLISQKMSIPGSGLIQRYGISLGRLLSFFQSSHPVSGMVPRTPGLLLFTAFIIGCYQVYLYKNRRQFIYLLLSAICLFLSTDFFPYNFLEMHMFIGRILAQIQLPFRFLSVALPLLCLLTGETINQLEKNGTVSKSKVGRTVILLNLVFVVFFLSDFSAGPLTDPKYETESLDTYTTGLLYLPKEASIDKYSYTKGFLTHGINSVSMLSRKTHTARFSVTSTNGGTLEAPILNYKGYHVTDSNGNEYPIRSGTNCRITFDVPAGFDGEMTIAFRDPRYWTAGIGISLVSFLLCLLIFRRKNSEVPSA